MNDVFCQKDLSAIVWNKLLVVRHTRLLRKILDGNWIFVNTHIPEIGILL